VASIRGQWRGPGQALADMQGHLFPWLAVFVGIGIAIWFALPWEPQMPFYLATAMLALAAGAAALRGPETWRPLAAAGFALAIGIIAAGWRAHDIRAPMLEFRYYGPIEGRLVEVDRSQSDALRLTLDQVVLSDVAPARTPVRVRISLQGDAVPLTPPIPGQRLILTGHLAAPEGAVEPGGFNFRRMAYFDQLGGVGYTRNPVLLLAPPADGAQWIDRLRTRLSQGIMTAVPGDAGAFSSGVLTGDQSGLSQDAVQALRNSSLAHLLAISGMNMVFIVGFVFLLLRWGIALIPPLALRIPAKKLAAGLSLGLAYFYLLLSGANVATERAFIMIAVALVAVMLDRRAITLRTAAISAILILLTKPESLVEAGFQMSFAATLALIAGFGALDREVMRQRMPRWAIHVFTLVLSSVIGGFATAPFAAAHFNRFSDYGLLANILTVPVMGAVVMPAGVMAALLAPFGLAALPLWVMEQGSRWILFVAHWVSAMDGSVTAIPAPGSWALPLITLGGLVLILWRGRLRLVGLAPIVVALGLWVVADRPALLIASDGSIVGLAGPEGRSLSVSRGGGFLARTWLEDDGDLTDQIAAAARPGFDGPVAARTFVLGDVRGIALRGKAGLARLDQACAEADIVILNMVAETRPEGCLLLDLKVLRQTGSVAIRRDRDAWRIMAAKDAGRLWTGAETPPGLLPERITGAKAGSARHDSATDTQPDLGS
jgi:competence protein ComEC